MIDDLKQYDEPQDDRRKLMVFREVFGNLVEESGINGRREKNRLRIMSSEINDFARFIMSEFREADAQNMVMKALYMMLELQTGQIDRKDGKPAICHPLQVGDDIPRRYGVKDPVQCVIGLGHDSIEDQGEKIAKRRERRLGRKLGNNVRANALAEMRDIFGERVSKALDGLSNPNFKSRARELKSKGAIASEREIKHYLYKEHIRTIIDNPDIFLVKFADIIRNYTRLKYIAKYRPVVNGVFRPALEKIGRSHPLYSCRDEMFKQIERVIVL